MAKETPSHTRKIAIVIIILGVLGLATAAFGAFFLTVGWGERQNAIAISKGELNPFKVDMSKPFEVIYGGSLGIVYDNPYDLEDGINLSRVISFGSCYAGNNFKIHFVDNKLSVTDEIKNSDNVTIAQIVDNNWKADPNSQLFYARNYNAYAFEIIDSDQTPITQVIMVGPNKLQIGGLLCYNEFGPIYALSTGIMADPSNEDLHSLINTKIFRYPATNPDNLGKMVNSLYPESDPLSESMWIIIASCIMIIVGTIGGTLGVLFGFEKYKDSVKNRDGHRKRRKGHFR